MSYHLINPRDDVVAIGMYYLYGDGAEDNVITAEWDRPVDGTTLRDTFQINIVDGSSNAIGHTYHGEQEQ